MRVLLAILLLTLPAAQPSLAGPYLCTGTQGAERYTMKLRIEAHGDTYLLHWLNARDQPVLGGIGVPHGAVLAVGIISAAGGLSAAVYRLSPGRLDGVWTRGDGTIDREQCMKGTKKA